MKKFNNKKTYRKKKFYKKPYNNSRNIRSVVRKELNKRDEVKTSYYSVTWTPDVNGLMGYPLLPSQGVGVNQRVGNEIYYKSLQISGSIYLETGSDYNVVRIVVFQWKNRNPNPPTIPDILQTDPVLLIPTVQSLYCKDVGAEFKVLSDRKIILTKSDSVKNFRIKITRGFDRRVQFIGTSVSYNYIYWLAISDSTIVPHPTMDYVYRMNYTDM